MLFSTIALPLAAADQSPNATHTAAPDDDAPGAEFLQYLGRYQDADGSFVDPLTFDQQAIDDLLGPASQASDNPSGERDAALPD